jgi:hypothetical protein
LPGDQATERELEGDREDEPRPSDLQRLAGARERPAALQQCEIACEPEHRGERGDLVRGLLVERLGQRRLTRDALTTPIATPPLTLQASGGTRLVVKAWLAATLEP